MSNFISPAVAKFTFIFVHVTVKLHTDMSLCLVAYIILIIYFPVFLCLCSILPNLSAQDLEKELHDLPAEKRLAVFDKIFAAYHDARGTIRNDLVCNGKLFSLSSFLVEFTRENISDSVFLGHCG